VKSQDRVDSSGAVNKLQAVVGEIESRVRSRAGWWTTSAGTLDVPGVDCRSDDERLSHREREVLRMLAHGWTISQIATQLALNVKTVSTYRVRVLRKFRYATTAQLMRYGISHHLDN
jgi:DNA-binding NarL/FixJ family response regulator